MARPGGFDQQPEEERATHSVGSVVKETDRQESEHERPRLAPEPDILVQRVKHGHDNSCSYVHRLEAISLMILSRASTRASHANGARRRSGARESVWGSPRGAAPRIKADILAASMTITG